ncbi:Apolipoprotein N-acyltransferase [Stratiformator vulcanicus]|uniref:Apolipoprotein N-acyltransferase n=2 Tax=Stratiformator vulcanicus TaxID=2527980 RepID=A0A517QVP4_9PLAN|nr:Apolipoprotein N-acyltransferase [Stratiformator vulcanicus]
MEESRDTSNLTPAAGGANANPAASQGRLDPAVRTIIASARKPERPPSLGAWVCGLVCGVLFWASFYPLAIGPLAWFAFTPLVMLIRIPVPTRWMYSALYLTTLAATLVQLQWMRLGDVTMYPAWIALSLYVAVYVPLTVFLCRVARTRLKVPAVIALPVVWVGTEWLQAHAFTGFSWYYLGHSQWQWTTLIQISDLVGGYGVSYVVATGAAVLGLFLPRRLYQSLRLEPPKRSDWPNNSEGSSTSLPPVSLSHRGMATAWLICLVAAACLYGTLRRDPAVFSPGPRVALIQGNFPTSLGPPTVAAGDRFRTYHQLTGLSVPYQPDLIVWPESVMPWPLLEAEENLSLAAITGIVPNIKAEAFRSGEMKEMFENLATQAGAAMMIGVLTGDVTARHGYRTFNSAAFSRPELGLVGRYDKVHRVPFGEFVPMRQWIPGLEQLTPYRGQFGLAKGEGPAKFEYEGHNFTPLICFEDTVPHLANEYVRRENPDVLVNLTNDGWFNESSEQEQHLISALFRTVETRTPLVRAVNTGISAVIDGDGVILEPKVFIDGETLKRTEYRTAYGGFEKDRHAVLVSDVPLDSRTSLYVRGGDWFAMSCAVFASFCLFVRFVPTRSVAI